MQKIKNNFIKIASIDSTNSLAGKMIKEKRQHDETVICTGFQTKGKGQTGNLWESEKDKNILLSVIWYPKSIVPTQQFYLSIVVSLAICDFLEFYGLLPMIKWPNDIFIKNKKIAGILIELGIMGDRITNVIAGIGINVNQILFNAYCPKATSLKIETGVEYKISDAVNKLLSCLSLRYNELNEDNFQLLKKQYINKLYRYNKLELFNAGENDFQAKITDINESGELVLLNKDKQKLVFAFKEVRFVDFNR